MRTATAAAVPAGGGVGLRWAEASRHPAAAERPSSLLLGAGPCRAMVAAAKVGVASVIL